MQKLCKGLLLVTSFFWLLNANGQKLTYNEFELLRISSQKSISQKNFDNQFSDIEGSPYFLADWLKGAILKNNGNEYQNLKLKIDLYQNKVFMNSHDTVYDMTDIPDVAYFIVYPDKTDTSNKITFSKNLPVPELKNRLIQLLSMGDASFLKKEVCQVNEIATDVTGNKQRQFGNVSSYYVLRDTGAVEVKKLNTKNFQSIFPDNADKIKAFVKSNNLSFSTEKGWIKIIGYYNSLN